MKHLTCIVERDHLYCQEIKKMVASSGHGVQGHDSAEIHRRHVVGRAAHDLLNYYSARLFRWMKCIPKCIEVTIGAQI